MNRIKYQCEKCDYRLLIVPTKKEILQKKKYDNICPKCKIEMKKSAWSSEDIRFSNATDSIFNEENFKWK